MANGIPNGIPNGRPDDGLFFDILIIGAGISGINAAYRIQTEGPADTTYAILERRSSLGGTWDLFRYPGIRSDSDIFTFGFPWYPWKHKSTLASGDQIKAYMTQAAQSQGIDHHILYDHSVVSANWSSADKNWELQVAVAGRDQPATFRARFVLLGTGYYDYEKPLETEIPGIDRFAGKVIHPQFWPKDYDYTNKNVVIIGSGATAVTLLPAMAETAKHVTMLQRSPGYIFSLPSNGLITALLFAVLPAAAAHYLSRMFWLVTGHLRTWFCRTWPGLAKIVIRRATQRQLPPHIPWDPHFRPRYNPWEQRFCACVDGDFFAALRSGKADVATGTIRTVTADAIELNPGGSVAALRPDVIVTATGLRLRFGGGIAFRVDGGPPVRWCDRFAWRSAMLQDVPNLLFLTGYEAASWTLGADVSARLLVRVLRRMRETGAQVAVPRVRAPMPEKSMMSLTSTYLKNVREVLPKGGTGVWAPKTNYFADMARARWGSLDADLEFS
ncbi:34906317-a913-4ec6-a215-1e6ba1def210 [Thermothielavioides terrestris]|uniref:34906317-a913-4ec6-a215-1e6ba1def210 n=1 Tax=Thermothielavioides terrestris TaxID=2587410 RepID=A0A446BD77_9PEZI|nr:34906317-a913-4ec6-a215-1e6ba1def210 [Thermothielavioides terrestris]